VVAFMVPNRFRLVTQLRNPSKLSSCFEPCVKNGVGFDRDQVWNEIVAERLQRMSDDA
jgi:hypothetical protein